MTIAKKIIPPNLNSNQNLFEPETLSPEKNKDFQINKMHNSEINCESSEILLQGKEKIISMESKMNLQEKKILYFVKERINNAILVENIGTEMTFSISNNPEYTKNYESFFEQIEKNKDILGMYLC